MKRLAIFDFDGTLINTPTPDIGKDIWFEKTGTKWPYYGWWSKPESLDMDIFDCEPINSVVNDYRDRFKSLDTIVIMLTGRLQKLEKEVKTILEKNNLFFDAYFFNKGGETIKNKIDVINTIVKNNDSIMDVEMWEDRLEHIPIFIEFGDILISNGLINTFKVNYVNEDGIIEYGKGRS